MFGSVGLPLLLTPSNRHMKQRLYIRGTGSKIVFIFVTLSIIDLWLEIKEFRGCDSEWLQKNDLL